MRSIELTARIRCLASALTCPDAENGVAIGKACARASGTSLRTVYAGVQRARNPRAFLLLRGARRKLEIAHRVAKAASDHFSPRFPEIATLAFWLKLSLLSLIVTGALEHRR